MADIRLKRLTKDQSEGIARYYVRLPGKRKVRIHGEPGSEEFMAAYRAATSAEPPIAKAERPKPTWFAAGTLGRAIQEYLA